MTERISVINHFARSRARAYGYFNGNLNAPDIGCVDNEEIWKVAKSFP